MVRLLTLASVLLVGSGLVVAWPLVRAALQFKPVGGQILDVIALPAEGDRVQLAIAYEYPLPTRGERALGYALTNDRLQPVDDPVVDAAQADVLQRALPGRRVRVFYDVNHPLDSAFMLSPVGAVGGIRPEHGVLLVLVGLGIGILGQLGRARGTQRRARD